MRSFSRLRATTLALSATALFAAACDPTDNDATPDPGGSPAGGEAAGGQDQPDSGAGGGPSGGVAPPVGGAPSGGVEPPVGGTPSGGAMPPVVVCDQPDAVSCRAAGCNWSDASGCSSDPPPLACDQLGMAACIARADCQWDGATCAVDPGLMPCASLDIFACAERADCVLDSATSTCGPRPDLGCEALDPETCLQRPECQLQEVFECDPAADPVPPPDNGGRPIAPPCPSMLICTPLGQPLPGDCNAYASPDACNADPACLWNDTGVVVGGGGAPEDCACPADMPDCGCAEAPPAPPPLPPEQLQGFCGYRGQVFDPCGGLDQATCGATPGCAVLEQPACPPCEPGVPCVDCLPFECVTVDLLCAGYATAELCEADARCDGASIAIGVPPCPENQPCPPIEGGEIFFCAPAPGPCDGLDAMTCAATAGCHVEQFATPGFCECAVDASGNEVCNCVDGGVVDVCVQDGAVPGGGGGGVPPNGGGGAIPGGAPDAPPQP